MSYLLNDSNILNAMILKSLSQGKEVTITFGYEAKNEGHYGLMMYHKNRLIKAYERVPCQRNVRIILFVLCLFFVFL